MTDPTTPTQVPNPSGFELAGVFVCPECAGLFEVHASGGRPGRQTCTCRKEAEVAVWPGYDFNEWIRLCDCCGRVVLSSGSRYSTWFCDSCGTKVQNLHRVLGRPAIPVARHTLTNGFRFPLDGAEGSGGADEAGAALIEALDFVAEGSERLERHKRHEVQLLLRTRGNPLDEPVALDVCLELAGTPGHDGLADSDPFRTVMHVFMDRILPNPVESVYHRKRASNAVEAFVRVLPEKKRRRAYETGPHTVHALCWDWAESAAHEVLPELGLLGSSVFVMMRGLAAHRALAGAARAALEAKHGAPPEPPLPPRPDDLAWAAKIFGPPPTGWP